MHIQFRHTPEKIRSIWNVKQLRICGVHNQLITSVYLVRNSSNNSFSWLEQNQSSIKAAKIN